jgi:hypothetical protein
MLVGGVAVTGMYRVHQTSVGINPTARGTQLIVNNDRREVQQFVSL